MLSVFDTDNDAITQYELWDSEGYDNWWADGSIVDASLGYKTGDLSGIWFRRDDESSDQTLWVRASDGVNWSPWDSFTLKTNGTPTVSVADQTVHPNGWLRLSDVFGFSDPNGDAPAAVKLWDGTGSHNWWADGGTVDATGGYETDDLSSVWIQGDAAPSAQTLWVQGSDGTAWSDWDSFTLLTA